MHIFIPGATGYIGRAVAQELHTHGHEIIGLARSDAAEQQLVELGYTAYRGDFTQPGSLLEALESVDAVINCATALHPDVDRGEVERQAIEAMLEKLVGSGKKFLYTSDQLIYGNTGEQIADENTPLNPPPFLAWRAKLEQTVLATVDQGVHAMVIRPVAVYGNNQDRMIPMLVEAASKVGYGFYVGDGMARWSLVHVNDLAVLYRLMIEQAEPGTLLVGSSDPSVSMRELAEVVAEIAGMPGEVQALSVEAASQILPPFVPVHGLTTNLQVSGKQAQTLLGWYPTHPSLLEEVRSIV